MADRVVVMNAGRIEQSGSPFEVYHQPASRFVASFVGQGNFIPVQLPDTQRAAGPATAGADACAGGSASPACLCVRKT